MRRSLWRKRKKKVMMIGREKKKTMCRGMRGEYWDSYSIIIIIIIIRGRERGNGGKRNGLLQRERNTTNNRGMPPKRCL